MELQGWQEKDIQEQTVSWRRAFHQEPELSGAEVKTAAKVVQALEEMGLKPAQAEGHRGVSATIEGGSCGPVVALRADMDGLPLTEETGLPFASKIPGVMHACGHDMHLAILLGAALRLQQKRQRLRGRVRLLFQPAEELSPTGGARGMIKSGFLQDVQAVFGLHVWPDLPCGKIGVKAGALMAASDRFKLTLLGKSAHAGHPHQGVDAILAATEVVQRFNQIISRRLDPVATATISIGTIHGGERYNVVAQEVVLEGTVRTLDEGVRAQIPLLMKRVLEGLKLDYGVEYLLDYRCGYPVLENWEEPVKLVTRTAQQLFGMTTLASKITPELIAEDFGVYLQQLPGAFLWLGCHKEGTPLYGLHNASFIPEEAALHLGSQLLGQVAKNALDALANGADLRG